MKGLCDVVILGAARTPIGSFRGCLSTMKAPQLGAVAIKGALEKAGVPSDAVEEVYMGNVLQAGVGQAPSRQATLFAGLSEKTPNTTVNKVCASGMKAIMLACQNIQTGAQKIMVAGGMESISNVPFYLNRGDTPYGGFKLLDGVSYDGLLDVYNQIHMGKCAEITAKQLKISRAEQDEYAMSSYRKSADHYNSGLLQKEIIQVTVPGQKEKKEISEDEEYKKVNFDEFSHLPTIFQKEDGTITPGNTSKLGDGAAAMKEDGTITPGNTSKLDDGAAAMKEDGTITPGNTSKLGDGAAAMKEDGTITPGNTSKLGDGAAAMKEDGTITPGNTSKLGDGAAAMVLASSVDSERRGFKPMARVVGFADAATNPVDIALAPVYSTQKLLAKFGIRKDEVAQWEVNEAFSVVVLANIRLLDIDPAKVNPHGGAISLGHPFGMSGARIITHLVHSLEPGQIGVASLCNGGGGASSFAIERL